MDAMGLGLAAMGLGAGRATAEDEIDPAVGLVLLKKPGQKVAESEPIVQIHHRGSVGNCIEKVTDSIEITEAYESPGGIVIDVVGP